MSNLLPRRIGPGYSTIGLTISKNFFVKPAKLSVDGQGKTFSMDLYALYIRLSSVRTCRYRFLLRSTHDGLCILKGKFYQRLSAKVLLTARIKKYLIVVSLLAGYNFTNPVLKNSFVCIDDELLRIGLQTCSVSYET